MKKGGVGHDWVCLGWQVEIETENISPDFIFLSSPFLELHEMEKWNEQDLSSCNIHTSSILPPFESLQPPRRCFHDSLFSFNFNEMSIRKDFLLIVERKNASRKVKKGKQPLEHSRLVSRLYEFFIRQMNCLIIMFIGVGLYPSFFLYSVALCIFKDIFIWFLFVFWLGLRG